MSDIMSESDSDSEMNDRSMDIEPYIQPNDVQLNFENEHRHDLKNLSQHIDEYYDFLKSTYTDIKIEYLYDYFYLFFVEDNDKLIKELKYDMDVDVDMDKPNYRDLILNVYELECIIFEETIKTYNGEYLIQDDNISNFIKQLNELTFNNDEELTYYHNETIQNDSFNYFLGNIYINDNHNKKPSFLEKAKQIANKEKMKYITEQAHKNRRKKNIKKGRNDRNLYFKILRENMQNISEPNFTPVGLSGGSLLSDSFSNTNDEESKILFNVIMLLLKSDVLHDFMDNRSKITDKQLFKENMVSFFKDFATVNSLNNDIIERFSQIISNDKFKFDDETHVLNSTLEFMNFEKSIYADMDILPFKIITQINNDDHFYQAFFSFSKKEQTNRIFYIPKLKLNEKTWVPPSENSFICFYINENTENIEIQQYSSDMGINKMILFISFYREFIVEIINEIKDDLKNEEDPQEYFEYFVSNLIAKMNERSEYTLTIIDTPNIAHCEDPIYKSTTFNVDVDDTYDLFLHCQTTELLINLTFGNMLTDPINIINAEIKTQDGFHYITYTTSDRNIFDSPHLTSTTVEKISEEIDTIMKNEDTIPPEELIKKLTPTYQSTVKYIYDNIKDEFKNTQTIILILASLKSRGDSGQIYSNTIHNFWNEYHQSLQQSLQQVLQQAQDAQDAQEQTQVLQYAQTQQALQVLQQAQTQAQQQAQQALQVQQAQQQLQQAQQALQTLQQAQDAQEQALQVQQALQAQQQAQALLQAQDTQAQALQVLKQQNKIINGTRDRLYFAIFLIFPEIFKTYINFPSNIKLNFSSVFSTNTNVYSALHSFNTFNDDDYLGSVGYLMITNAKKSSTNYSELITNIEEKIRQFNTKLTTLVSGINLSIDFNLNDVDGEEEKYEKAKNIYSLIISTHRCYEYYSHFNNPSSCITSIKNKIFNKNIILNKKIKKLKSLLQNHSFAKIDMFLINTMNEYEKIISMMEGNILFLKNDNHQRTLIENAIINTNSLSPLIGNLSELKNIIKNEYDRYKNKLNEILDNLRSKESIIQRNEEKGRTSTSTNESIEEVEIELEIGNIENQLNEKYENIKKKSSKKIIKTIANLNKKISYMRDKLNNLKDKFKAYPLADMISSWKNKIVQRGGKHKKSRKRRTKLKNKNKNKKTKRRTKTKTKNISKRSKKKYKTRKKHKRTRKQKQYKH